MRRVWLTTQTLGEGPSSEGASKTEKWPRFHAGRRRLGFSSRPSRLPSMRSWGPRFHTMSATAVHIRIEGSQVGWGGSPLRVVTGHI